MEKPESDAHKEMEAELHARDEFFSAVAHELRNPLNALHLTLAGLLRAQSGGHSAPFGAGGREAQSRFDPSLPPRETSG